MSLDLHAGDALLYAGTGFYSRLIALKTWHRISRFAAFAAERPPRIQKLLCLGCPSAIFWRVGTVIVNAFNRMLWTWSVSHVRIELFKRTPARIYGDASGAVILERRIVGISASLNHLAPCAMNTSVRHGVLASGIAEGFDGDASAIRRFAIAKVLTFHDSFRSAIASRYPSSSTVANTGLFFQNRPRSESVAGNINQVAHKHLALYHFYGVVTR